MKKIMVMLMSAVVISTAPVAAYARGAELRSSHAGSFHGGVHNFHSGHGNQYAYRRGNFRGHGYGGYYGDNDDDFVGPLIAGGIFGAVIGNALNR